MNDTQMNGALDRMVREYLKALDRALTNLPSGRRAQLIEEIRAHVAELRAEHPIQSVADMESLLERVGRPEDIAAAAMDDQQPVRGARFSRRFVTGVVLAVVVVPIAAAVGAAALASRPV